MKILILLLSVLPSIALFSQTTIPNASFENWENVGETNAEPTSWSSNKTGGGFANLGPQTCSRSAGTQSGSYCLKVETKSYFGMVVNGSATTGKIEAPSASPSAGYIRTVRAEDNHNTSFTGRPDSLVGYYKYKTSGGDQASVKIILHGAYDVEDPDQTGSKEYTIAVAEFSSPSSSINGWTRFSVPFTYLSKEKPKYILATIASSNSLTNAKKGSILWVDNLSLVY
jgi:hypothetical protein